jgi:primosomal protein N' (replication factor Y)
MTSPILRIAVPSPLHRLFDYLPPRNPHPAPLAGQRVRVPFGKGECVGILVEVAAESEVPLERLRPATAILDTEPLLPAELMRLLTWSSSYYHHPPGEVYASALPVTLREGGQPNRRGEIRWRLTEAGQGIEPASLNRAPKQGRMLAMLAQHELTTAQLSKAIEQPLPILRRLEEKGWVAGEEQPCLGSPAGAAAEQQPELNGAQGDAVMAIHEAAGSFQALLLDGVTGSGKTEVYLQAIAPLIAAGQQVLVLVPEIGLTPQLVERFRRRFPVPLALLHSGLSDGERQCAWLMAREGTALLVIGTRSALFTPLKHPGLIIVDEEHDTSFKQQEGFRYSARDMAIVRARQLGIPIVLGSATPSLESLHNAQAGRYRLLRLPERAGSALHPQMRLLDVRQLPMQEGLSEPLVMLMRRHLEKGGQVLLFLNRRGYAPALICHDCGHVAECPRCDARLTYHSGQRRLRCHHCGTERPVPRQCPKCGSADLRPLGQGTERIEEGLKARFPGVGMVRIDRDTTSRKGAMEALLQEVHAGDARILIGTQMLAKGHHFPEVTLVGILDADQGLFSADFRASERMAQLILQVAGRAGRADRPGEVVIQTHAPDHPLLRTLVEADYHTFAQAALIEREQVFFPPFSYLALLRAEAVDSAAPLAFLEAARQLAEGIGVPNVQLMGPVPAPMERRAGRTRAQLLLQSPSRAGLHHLLEMWVTQLEQLKEGRKVRWSLDVDPVELY